MMRTIDVLPVSDFGSWVEVLEHYNRAVIIIKDTSPQYPNMFSFFVFVHDYSSGFIVQ